MGGADLSVGIVSSGEQLVVFYQVGALVK